MIEKLHGILNGPYVYAIIAGGRLFIDTATKLPVSEWAREIGEDGYFYSEVAKSGGRISSPDGIFLYCCKCDRLMHEEAISMSRLLNGLGSLVYWHFSTKQTRLNKDYELVDPPQNITLRHLGTDKVWLNEYAEEIYNDFKEVMAQSFRPRKIMISSC